MKKKIYVFLAYLTLVIRISFFLGIVLCFKDKKNSLGNSLDLLANRLKLELSLGREIKEVSDLQYVDELLCQFIKDWAKDKTPSQKAKMEKLIKLVFSKMLVSKINLGD